MTVFFARGIKNSKPFYKIYRRAPGGKVALLKQTASAAALARFIVTQELPRKSTSAPFKAKSPSVRSNPAEHYSDERGAARMSESFTGRAPDDSEYREVPAPKLPDSMAAIGKVFAIEYLAERDGKVYRFRHVFKARSRPHLAVSPDGNFVTMLGGAWRFTEDGFEDK